MKDTTSELLQLFRQFSTELRASVIHEGRSETELRFQCAFVFRRMRASQGRDASKAIVRILKPARASSDWYDDISHWTPTTL